MTATDHADEEHYQSSLPGPLGLIDTLIGRLEAVLLAAGVLLMAVNTIANVIARFVIGDSIFFTGEVNRILIIMITFAGIGYAARHGRHIRMSAIYDALPAAARRVLMILIALFTALVMFFLFYYSLVYILDLKSRGRVLPALGFPIWVIYIWAPLGFLITGIQYLLTAIKNLNAREVYLSTGVTDSYQDTETETEAEAEAEAASKA